MKTTLKHIVAGCILFCLMLHAAAHADTIVGFDQSADVHAPVSFGGSVVDNVFVPASGQNLTSGQSPSPNLDNFTIVIVPGSGLSGNAAALAAFQRAANAWMARISDPITVTINANLLPLGAGVIGSSSSTVLQAGYNTIRNAVVADAAADPDDAIMASTPTAAQFSAVVPGSATLTGNLLATKANLKALGFSGLDDGFGASDGAINFNSTFSFDFDNSDGVGAGQMDFETVAAHEIGHALGFASFVDSIVGGATAISPFTLDLLRFLDNVPGANPATAAEFTTFPRGLIAGGDAILDGINDPERRMSTGVSGVGADGRQASHWKDNDLTGILIGLMDPTLAFGTAIGIGEADLRALDLIGYDVVPVPEPTTLSLALAGLLTLRGWRNRHRC